MCFEMLFRLRNKALKFIESFFDFRNLWIHKAAMPCSDSRFFRQHRYIQQQQFNEAFNWRSINKVFFTPNTILWLLGVVECRIAPPARES